MPVPRKNEKKEDFINRCIPYVIHEGTTKDPKQATAICNSIWRKSKKKKKSNSWTGKADMIEEFKIILEELKIDLMKLKEKMK